MNLEHFYENLFSTSSHGILHLIRGNSRMISPSGTKFFYSNNSISPFSVIMEVVELRVGSICFLPRKLLKDRSVNPEKRGLKEGLFSAVGNVSKENDSKDSLRAGKHREVLEVISSGAPASDVTSAKSLCEIETLYRFGVIDDVSQKQKYLLWFT